MPEGVGITKPYHEMTPAERLATRIAKNREIDQRVQASPVPEKKRKTTATAERTKAASNALDKFHEIRKAQGIDAAAEYLVSKRNQ
jgi:hypothetical protein